MEQKTDFNPWAWIEEQLPALGFSHFGIAELKKPVSFVHYETWLEQGFQAKMGYLERHAPLKEYPQKTFSPAQSAFVFAAPYWPHPEGPSPLKSSRVALYAQGADYHHWLKQKMQTLVDQLQKKYPDETFLTLTDSAPLLERDLAHKASLGWFGKNTCLIHPKKGSLFLIGEILTSLKINLQTEPLPDFCGTCQKCIQICPTGALVAPQKLDANKCISYLTIESREIPPIDLRKKIGDWLFGCDLCQTICPWNEKIFKGQLSISKTLTLDSTQELNLIEELRWLLITSHKQIQKKLFGTPLLRAGAKNLKRNALIVIGNRKMTALKTEVEGFVSHPELAELARWTLEQF